eukprot:TRINITY_DN2114_c0_g1_i3.p1 TRINITY_DN2114_c0_g1~~TRINITY_DN2114_c0_g1_i3.p1  ORF type:complete len:531 (+),score=145.23 TRINITY_DN2114_c0_g1_i3:98-1690(+)
MVRPFSNTVHPSPPGGDDVSLETVGDQTERKVRRSVSARSGPWVAEDYETTGNDVRTFDDNDEKTIGNLKPTVAVKGRKSSIAPSSDADLQKHSYDSMDAQLGNEGSGSLPGLHIQAGLLALCIIVPVLGVMLNHMFPWKPRAGKVLEDPLVGPIVGQQVWVVWTYPPFMAFWLLRQHHIPATVRNVVVTLAACIPAAAALIVTDLYTLANFSKATYYLVFYFLKFVAIYLVWSLSLRLAWPFMFRAEDATVRADVPRYRATWNWIYPIFVLNIMTNFTIYVFLTMIIVAKSVGAEQQNYIVVGLTLLSSADKFFLRMLSFRLGTVAKLSRRDQLDLRNSMLYYYELQLQLMFVSALPFLADYSVMAFYLVLESGVLLMQTVFDTDWFRATLRRIGAWLWSGHDNFLEFVFGISGETRVASLQLLALNITTRVIASTAILASGALVRYGPNKAFYAQTKNAYAVLTPGDYEKNIYYLFLFMAVALIHGLVARFVLRRIYGVDSYVECVKVLHRFPVLIALAGFAASTWAY